MNTEFYRKYIDIIKENSQEPQRLDEGMLDKAKSLLPKFMKMLGADAEVIANKVKQVTGGDFSLSKDNIQKVIKGLDLDNLQKQPANEAIAGNWQGKLIQALYSLGLLGSAGVAAANIGTPMAMTSGIALLLLLFAGTFFGSGSGQIGAMGKFGNKGLETEKGQPENLRQDY